MNNHPSTICVCGAGTMGSGIAQICAQHGLNTILFDIDENTLTKAKLKIDADLQSLADKKKIGADEKNKIISAIKFTRNSDDCIADLIIEAIVENAQLKADLINRIADINMASAIFATNTSSLSVTSIAEKLKRPEHFAGLHFFNPAPVMKLVEVVQTPFSTSETINILTGFAKMLGKVPVVCKDAPGFIVNHVARPYYLEALYLVEKGISDFNTIDKLMEATGFKMGPFKLMDLIGNDINYSVTCIVHEAFGKPPRLKPSPIQEEKVNEGSLGRKTGKGYYEYPAK